MFRYRDRQTTEKVVSRLKEMKLNIRVMHVCGTHQDTIVRYGLDQIFRECGIDMRQGPGCPVCVTTPREFEEAMTLAKNGKIIASFGDAVRVPGVQNSLLDLRSKGHDVRIVYSIEDALKIAKKTEREVVFLAIGFETTAPSTAVTILNDLPENFSILSCHRYVPPALFKLMDLGEIRLNGLIEPGHVSTIIGVKPYEPLSRNYRIPQVVAGFEPLDMLIAVYMLARQIQNGEAKVENEYTRSVAYEGNVKALKVMDEAFEPFDTDWRGFPIIAKSGMKLRKKYESFDARKIYAEELREVAELEIKSSEKCRCNEILRGLLNSSDCELFGKACTPQHPVGPCMVSVEGLCNIQYRYSSRKRLHKTL
jgi:hydrogenase expression/formation protein HypD